jgi:transposase
MLHRDGMSARAIARALQVGRNRVKGILAKRQAAREQPHCALPTDPVRTPRPSKLDGHHERVQQLLEKYPDITSQRIFEMLRGEGYEGGLTVVKDHLRRVRPRKAPTVSQPVAPTLPGELAECDWSPFTVRFSRAPAKTLQVFGYVLRYSRRKHFGFYPTCDLHALMDGHVQAFSRLGGVAKRCKYDNQKAVVLRWEGRQPVYNPRFIDFATHYDFQVEACRPFHPNDKPAVERSFDELARSFFNGRCFRDEADLAEQLVHWLATVCDVRVHRKTKRTALELFEQERPHLLPLPVHHYDTARVIYRVCDTEGHVAWRGNRYGVPVEHVTDLLPVRVTQSEIFVYSIDLRCIARHELRPTGAGEDVTLPGRRPAARRGADLDQLRQAYQDLGEGAARFLQGLESAQPRSAAYHARLVLALRERFATHDLIKALVHATRFGAFEHHAVERILVARSTPRGLDEYVAEATAQKLAAVLGETQTAPRDLHEYDQLPCWSRAKPLTSEDPPCPPPEPDSDPQSSQPSSDPPPAPPAAERTPSEDDSAATSSNSD